jgi:phospholipase/carboxylesterase
MNDMLDGFHLSYHAGADASAPVLLLLHGTGGDENDLVPFARMAAPDAALLGLRGRSPEGFVNRWFRRHGEGIFDLPDMEGRAAELAAVIGRAGRRFGFTGPPIAIGYSNGANIAAALLMRHPQALGGAVLMRAMNGLSPAPGLDLGGKRVLLLSGRQDPLAPEASRAILVGSLQAAGAHVDQRITAPGHSLDRGDVEAVREWLTPPAM